MCSSDLLKVLASWDPRQFTELSAPFRERYPHIRIQYSRGGTYDRGVKTIVSYKDGRYVADVVGSTSNAWIKLKEMDGLVDLDVLPNYKLLDQGRHDADGKWVGQKLAYRCMAYNTSKIKAADLPKTWDDLLTNPVWRNGTLGLPDVPDVWLAMLWQAKGPEWSTNFLNRLFKEVKPQLRKEGTSAVVALTAAGDTGSKAGAIGSELGRVLDVAEGALLLDEPAVLAEHLEWLRATSAAHAVPGSVLEAALAGLAVELEASAPRAATLLASAIA